MDVIELLTPEEVCKRIKCSRRTLDRMIADGTMRPLRFRGLIRFHPDELESLIEAFGFDPDHVKPEGE
jgi:excisionase family DNA binding protein